MQHLRNTIMQGVGTDEAFIQDDWRAFEAATGHTATAIHWRKPLRIDEINRMASTPEVRARQGRP